MKISACYITKNEERNIARSLQSLADAADEIIVVDTESTDKTREIAEAMGARVLNFSWQDDFSAPRNFAVEAASGDWIVFLDADEWFVEPQGVRSTIEAEIGAASDLEAMMLLRLNLDDQGKEFSRDRSLRIFRNAPWLRYHGKIHENVYSSRGRLRVSYPEGLVLNHDGYRGGMIEEKIERNLSLMLRDIEKNGHAERFYPGLTDCFYHLRQYERCLEMAFSGLEFPTYPRDTRRGLYHVALESMRSLSLPLDLMCDLMDCAQAEFPDLPEFYAEKGILLSCRGEMEQAVCNLEKAAALFEDAREDEVFPYFYKGGGIAYERLAQIYRVLGRYDFAALNFLKSSCFQGGMPPSAKKLLEEMCRICGIQMKEFAGDGSTMMLPALLQKRLLQGRRSASPAMARMCRCGLLLVAAACVPQATVEMLAFLPKTLQEKWKGYEIVKKKKEIDDAHIGMLDYTE